MDTSSSKTLAKHLSVKDICDLMGEPRDRAGQLRVIRRLRYLETQLSKKILYGSQGRPLFTTTKCLEDALPMLVDNTKPLLLLLKTQLDEIENEQMASLERQRLLGSKIRNIERVIEKMTKHKDA